MVGNAKGWIPVPEERVFVIKEGDTFHIAPAVWSLNEGSAERAVLERLMALFGHAGPEPQQQQAGEFQAGEQQQQQGDERGAQEQSGIHQAVRFRIMGVSDQAVNP